MVFYIGSIMGYWQVEVSKEDREETAFVMRQGLFEFKVMPFGLCNAPATFQRLMDLVLASIHWSSCLVYIDNIVIMGHTFQQLQFETSDGQDKRGWTEAKAQ